MGKKHNQGRYTSQKRSITPLLMRIAVILLIIDVSAIGMVYWNRQAARTEFAQMAAAVQEARQESQIASATEPVPTAETILPMESEADADASTEAPTEVPTEEPVQATESTEPAADPELEKVLEPYRQFYQENKDMVGWVSIEGTAIAYPVMQTPEDPEKYLHTSFKGDYSYAGVPFLDYRCTENSDNLLIYGHNMSDGSMFNELVEYRLKSYWREHPVIRFDSLYEEREFEVFAVFYDRVYYTHEPNFRFYDFIDAKNESDFNVAVKKFREKSEYNTGIIPQYGQQLVMLVTCTYREDNGRFVVVACEKSKA